MVVYTSILLKRLFQLGDADGLLQYAIHLGCSRFSFCLNDAIISRDMISREGYEFIKSYSSEILERDQLW